jgi:hypothetical protein
MTMTDLPVRAIWRGERVVVVSIRGEKAQIARPRIGLRWVRLDELEAA